MADEKKVVLVWAMQVAREHVDNSPWLTKTEVQERRLKLAQRITAEFNKTGLVAAVKLNLDTGSDASRLAMSLAYTRATKEEGG